MDKNSPMKTDEQLKQMPDEALHNLYRYVKKELIRIKNTNGPRCCNLCHRYIGDNWEKDVGQFTRPVRAYLNRIIDVINSRPLVSFHPKAKAERRKERLAGLKGNRRPRNRNHKKAGAAC